jgi:hypothetical protein
MVSSARQSAGVDFEFEQPMVGGKMKSRKAISMGGSE